MDYHGKVVVMTGRHRGSGTRRRRRSQRGRSWWRWRAVALLQKLIAECRPRRRVIRRRRPRRSGGGRARDRRRRAAARADRRPGQQRRHLKHKHTFHTTAEEADLVMRVNFMSCVWTTYAAIPPMLRQGGGVIVNVSSFAARSRRRARACAASKAAMNAFSEGLWNDLAGSNIHVASSTQARSTPRSGRRRTSRRRTTGRSTRRRSSSTRSSR